MRIMEGWERWGADRRVEVLDPAVRHRPTGGEVHARFRQTCTLEGILFLFLFLAVWGEKSWSLRSGGEMRFPATLVRYSLNLVRAPQAL